MKSPALLTRDFPSLGRITMRPMQSTRRRPHKDHFEADMNTRVGDATRRDRGSKQSRRRSSSLRQPCSQSSDCRSWSGDCRGGVPSDPDGSCKLALPCRISK